MKKQKKHPKERDLHRKGVTPLSVSLPFWLFRDARLLQVVGNAIDEKLYEKKLLGKLRGIFSSFGNERD